MRFKSITFTLLALLAIILAIASLLSEPERVYSSLWFTILWGAMAVTALVYLVRCKVWRAPATMVIHLAFLVILCGALTTHLFGDQGSLHLRYGEPSSAFVLKGEKPAPLPFTVALDTFYVTYYQGTSTPEDFTSRLRITDGDAVITAEVSMNNIYRYRHYRFYQAGFDADHGGSKLSIAHDPYGIAITYTGYALLLLGMALFFFQKNSRFRKLLGFALLAFLPAALSANNMPKVAPTDVAEQLGDLYLLYNGRICPIETYAHDFVMKIYGKSTYRGRKAEEVLAGWIFFPNTWKPEPMIAVKGGALKRTIGTTASHVSLRDFANELGEYKLTPTLQAINSGDFEGNSAIFRAADEKISIINAIFTGAALKIFPARAPDGTIEWFSPNDNLPDYIPAEKQLFIRKSLDYVSEKVITRRYTEARQLIAKIKAYQMAECGDVLPTEREIAAERLYTRTSSSKPWAMGCLTLGILAFAYFTVCTTKRQTPHRFVLATLNILGGVVWLYLILCFTLRTIISHHLPISNGFEIMQALAWICLTLMFCLQRKVALSLPFGFIVSGLALLVAMIGESNPAVTNLIPVLNSPLLSLHVMVIMVAYALFAFCMLNGIAAHIFYIKRIGLAEKGAELRRSSELMLYPALFLLAIGIFIGAIWANVSWGRYWGWDAIEVWALITMIIYAFPIHATSIKWFRSDKHLHLYLILAFLSVLMTYFGANFFLTGLHSYA